MAPVMCPVQEVPRQARALGRRRGWRLAALLLAALTLAPDGAARAKKAAAKGAGKGAKVAKLSIARPENAGIMNRVPARVVLEPADGVVSTRMTHLGREAKVPSGALVLAGGDTAELDVREGTYSVHVLTPVENQPPGGLVGRKAGVWASPKVKVVLAHRESICLQVEAGVTDTDYNGSWLITKAAPADCAGAVEQ